MVVAKRAQRATITIAEKESMVRLEHTKLNTPERRPSQAASSYHLETKLISEVFVA